MAPAVRLHHLTVIILFFSMSAPAMARTTSQFQTFFPAWEGMLKDIIATSCQDEREKYQDPSNKERSLAFYFANCILKEMKEFHKTEMGITAVILGLLPNMLQQLGPKISEVGVLAMRRPLLALLLGLGMPSVSTGGSMDDPDETLVRSVYMPVRSGVLSEDGQLWRVISMTEYLIATGAVANVFHQVYQLAYWSISISSIAIESGHVSQTYPAFLWIMLLVPAHGFGFWSLRLRYTSTSDSDQMDWIQTFKSEFLPCAHGRPLFLEKRKAGLLSTVVYYVTKVASLTVFIFGTVALSSQIFISLGDIVPVIARFLLGTLVCRAILVFELHGLRENTSAINKVRLEAANCAKEKLQRKKENISTLA